MKGKKRGSMTLLKQAPWQRFWLQSCTTDSVILTRLLMVRMELTTMTMRTMTMIVFGMTMISMIEKRALK